MKRLLAVSFLVLAGCAVAYRPPVETPKPPAPTPAPTPKPSAPVDPTACTDDTPDASFFKLDVSWNHAHTVAWIDSTAKVKDDVFCPKYNTNPNSQGTCPLRPEGHPQAADCSRKHGVPAWFLATDSGAFVLAASDEHDDWHIHAPKGSTVKACLAKYLPAQSRCSEPVTVN